LHGGQPIVGCQVQADGALVCPDGALHDIMLYNGADRTGPMVRQRRAAAQLRARLLKDMPEVWDDILTLDIDSSASTGKSPMVALAKACRGALIARPGKDLYAADFNAIEARKLAWLSGCTTAC
jgi:DNA polymerase